ncbi:MAG: efflux RND transporter periplasmic adaptor subunit [Alcanivoracaceae bacterium]
MLRNVLSVIALGLVVLAQPAVAQSGGGAAASSSSASAQSVRVLIMAPRSARLASQMSGQVITLPLKMGQAFKSGDLLVGFDCERQRALLARAQAELDRAESGLASQRALVRLEAVSELDVAIAESDVAYSRAGVMDARAAIKYCEVRAPYSGRVVTVRVNQFESVGPGEMLIEIVESGELHLEALVPSSWLGWIREGAAFAVDVDELRQTVSAKVVAIGARVDPVSQTVAIRGRIELPPEGLRPGMSGNARFQVPSP